MNDFSKMWQTALIEIETAVSQANFSTWFKETLILREEEGTIFLGVPNSFTQEWLQKKFHNAILRILRQMDQRVRAIEYVIVGEKNIPRGPGEYHNFAEQIKSFLAGEIRRSTQEIIAAVSSKIDSRPSL